MRSLTIPLLLILCACGAGAPGPGLSMDGDCGPVLSAAECQIIRAQLGTLDPQPPADPTNRWGRWTGGSTNERDEEDRAVALGQRLFFDRCLSQSRDTSCETCHDRQVGLIDPRASELQIEVTTPEGKSYLPPIVDPTPQRATRPPPEVSPLRDLNGDPLARWDAKQARWVGVVRRHQSSRGSGGAGYTPRNSPTVYNLAYGAAVPPHDGARTAGTTWVPLDGRYDSAWALVADVYEFGATNRTNRAQIAYRIFKKHRTQYEAMIGGRLPDMDMMDASQPTLRRYPRDASPNTAFNAAWVACWKGPNRCDSDATAPMSAAVRDEITTIFIHAGKALSAYMRRLRSGDAAYDRWLRNDHSTAQTCDGQASCPMGESCDRRISRCVMSVAAQRGLRLFIGKAECVMCHAGPNFTDWRFHNLGVPEDDPERRTAGSAISLGKDGPFAPPPPSAPACSLPGAGPATACPDQGRHAWQNRLAGACAPQVDKGGALMSASCQKSDAQSCATPYSDNPSACMPKALFDPCNHADAQACRQAGACQWIDGMNASGLRQCVPRPHAADLGAFKTPSLRNVARTWPYMHNGALYDYGPAERGEVSTEDPTPHLLRVVSFYNEGGARPTIGDKDPLIRPLHLSGAEMSDLVEFLKALSDESASAGPLLTAPSDLADVSKCPE